MRESAAAALGGMGEAAAEHGEVVTTLVTWLRDEDEWVRERAAEALGRMGEAAARHPEVVATLVTWLRDEDDGVHQSAAAALGRITARTRIFKGRRGKLTVRTVEELSRTDGG